MKDYFRPAIGAMSGYVPGEQPKMANLIKLNTNENPYPPAPGVKDAVALAAGNLRLYPDPQADELCQVAARLWGFRRNEVLAGNGSDDILTMIFRSFTDKERKVACLSPSYSLYKTLAAMQEAPVMEIALNPEDFSLPENLLQQVKGANLLIITRPNAPTGNSFPHSVMHEICARFDGVVLFDEAYADFADDNCLDLAKEFDNVLVSRTFSKSYSLAGVRLGLVMGSAELLTGLNKVKDSYNVDRLAQAAGIAALKDQEYLRKNIVAIRRSREFLGGALKELGFEVVPSCANFLFASPPDRDGERCFKFLRDHAVVVRYFPGEITGRFVRITVGTTQEITTLLEVLGKLYGKNA